jgi:hypothetical protein
MLNCVGVEWVCGVWGRVWRAHVYVKKHGFRMFVCALLSPTTRPGTMLPSINLRFVFPFWDCLLVTLCDRVAMTGWHCAKLVSVLCWVCVCVTAAMACVRLCCLEYVRVGCLCVALLVPGACGRCGSVLALGRPRGPGEPDVPRQGQHWACAGRVRYPP